MSEWRKTVLCGTLFPMLQAQNSLLDLNAEQLRELAAALIIKISEQSKTIAAKEWFFLPNEVGDG